MLFSLEQKAPHAWVDAVMARKLKLKPVQIKQCNQLYRPLPEPVFSDLFLCDTPQVMHNFRQVWPEQLNNVDYIGTFNAVTVPPEHKKTDVPKSSAIKLCFFLGVHTDVNRATLSILHSWQQKTNVQIFIKPHPRHHQCYKSIIPGAHIISNQTSLFGSFCQQFDLALTYPSGVVSDLLSTTLPFVIYTPDHMDYHSIKEDSALDKIAKATSVEALHDTLLRIEEIITEHAAALTFYYNHSGVVTDIDVIESKLVAILDRA